MTHLSVCPSVWVPKTPRATQIAVAYVREAKSYSGFVAGERKRENDVFDFRDLQFNRSINCIDLEGWGGKLLPEVSVVISLSI